jgi:hypothetical protein
VPLDGDRSKLWMSSESVSHGVRVRGSRARARVTARRCRECRECRERNELWSRGSVGAEGWVVLRCANPLFSITESETLTAQPRLKPRAVRLSSLVLLAIQIGHRAPYVTNARVLLKPLKWMCIGIVDTAPRATAAGARPRPPVPFHHRPTATRDNKKTRCHTQYRGQSSCFFSCNRARTQACLRAGERWARSRGGVVPG